MNNPVIQWLTGGTSAKTNKKDSTKKTKKTSSVTKIKVNDAPGSNQFTAGFPVRINVYVMKKLCQELKRFGITGVGVFHSGTEVHDQEWAYGGHPADTSGIFQMLKPRDLKSLSNIDGTFEFLQTLRIGYTTEYKSLEQVKSLLDRMAVKWKGNQYHLLTKNCNHFSNQLCLNLCGRGIPSWINQSANTMACVPFVDRIIPVEYLTPQKVKKQPKTTQTSAKQETRKMSSKDKVAWKQPSNKCSTTGTPSEKETTKKDKTTAIEARMEPTTKELEKITQQLQDNLKMEKQTIAEENDDDADEETDTE